MELKLDKKFQKALDWFIWKYIKDSNVIGIIVTGSVIHSTPDKNSDLDVYVILKESKNRERGNTRINGIEIEYFINPVKQVSYYLTNELWKHTAHMLSHWVIIHQKDKIIDKLIKDAKKTLNAKLPALDKVKKELAKYFLDDRKKDLEDALIKKDVFAFLSLANDLLNRSLDTFYNVHRLPQEKIKRLYNQIKSIDHKFANLYWKALSESDMKQKYKLLLKLITYTENLLWGKRAKEWKLISKCNV